MIDLWRVVALRLIIACMTTFVHVSADAAKCSDIFNTVLSEVAGQGLYNQDFGPGVFVRKIHAKEFHLEPPPVIVDSARAAQRKTRDVARSNRNDKFTVLFEGFSEGEVLGFKAMLQRDSRLEGDDRLTFVLLETETAELAEVAGYKRVREPAIKARNQMLRRYDWTKTTVRREEGSPSQRLDRYRLTLAQSGESESFLLTLHLKALRFVKDRTARIVALLTVPALTNATAEQMAHAVISDLKKSDKGITDGTLKAMAGDFIISQASEFRYE
jgi:hypothetical protein